MRALFVLFGISCSSIALPASVSGCSPLARKTTLTVTRRRSATPPAAPSPAPSSRRGSPAGARPSATHAALTAPIDSRCPRNVPFELPRATRRIRRTQVIAMAGQSQPITRDVTLPVGGVSDTLVVTAARGAGEPRQRSPSR